MKEQRNRNDLQDNIMDVETEQGNSRRYTVSRLHRVCTGNSQNPTFCTGDAQEKKVRL
jgi:hypothetical protein